MPQVLRCPNCTKSMQVPDNVIGKTVRCPSCTKPFTVPAPATTPTGRTPQSSNGTKAPAAAPETPTKCPACGSMLIEGAVACMDCGFLLQAEARRAGRAAEPVRQSGLRRRQPARRSNVPAAAATRCRSPAARCCTTAISLEKLLAMGGFGAVYLATDTKHNNRPVAIKDMIGDDPQEFAIRLNFFRREAEILRSLETVPDRAARLRLHRAGPDGPPGHGVHPRQGPAQDHGGERQQAVPR